MQLSSGRPRGDKEFVVGKTVATSRGKVVYRNKLIELIQYYPSTGKVHPEPILIVPAGSWNTTSSTCPAKFAGEVPDRSGLHRVHDLLAQS